MIQGGHILFTPSAVVKIERDTTEKHYKYNLICVATYQCPKVKFSLR